MPGAYFNKFLEHSQSRIRSHARVSGQDGPVNDYGFAAELFLLFAPRPGWRRGRLGHLGPASAQEGPHHDPRAVGHAGAVDARCGVGDPDVGGVDRLVLDRDLPGVGRLGWVLRPRQSAGGRRQPGRLGARCRRGLRQRGALRSVGNDSPDRRCAARRRAGARPAPTHARAARSGPSRPARRRGRRRRHHRPPPRRPAAHHRSGHRPADGRDRAAAQSRNGGDRGNARDRSGPSSAPAADTEIATAQIGQ